MDTNTLQSDLLDNVYEQYALCAEKSEEIENPLSSVTGIAASGSGLPPLEDKNVDFDALSTAGDTSILDLIMKMRDAQERTLELEKEAARLTGLRDCLVAKMEGLESEGSRGVPPGPLLVGGEETTLSDVALIRAAAVSGSSMDDLDSPALLYPEILPFLQSEVVALGEAAERLLSSGDTGEESLGTLTLIKERMALLEKLESLAHMEAELSLLEEEQMQEAAEKGVVFERSEVLPSNAVVSSPMLPLDAAHLPSLASLSQDTQAACISARLAVVKSLVGGLGEKGGFSAVIGGVFEGLDSFEYDRDDNDLAATLSYLAPGAPPPLFTTPQAILAVFRCGIRTALCSAASGLTGENIRTRELAQLPPGLLTQLTETRAFGDSFRKAMIMGLLGGIPLAGNLLAKSNALVEQLPSVLPSPPHSLSSESNAPPQREMKSITLSGSDTSPHGTAQLGVAVPFAPFAPPPSIPSPQVEPWFVRLTHHRQGKVRGPGKTVPSAPPLPPPSPPKGEGRWEFRVFPNAHPLSHFAPPDGPTSLEVAQTKGVAPQPKTAPSQPSLGGEPWWTRMTHHRTRTTDQIVGKVQEKTGGEDADTSGLTEDMNPLGATRSRHETFASIRDGSLRGSAMGAKVLGSKTMVTMAIGAKAVGTKVKENSMRSSSVGILNDHSSTSSATAFNLESTQHSASGLDLAPFFTPNGTLQFIRSLANEDVTTATVSKPRLDQHKAPASSVNATRRSRAVGKPPVPFKKPSSVPFPTSHIKSISAARQGKGSSLNIGPSKSEVVVSLSRGISVHTLADGVPGGLGTAHTHHAYHGVERGGKWLHIRRPPPLPTTAVLEPSLPPTQAPYLVSSLAHSAGLSSFSPSAHTRVWWHAPLPVPVPSSSGKVAETNFVFKEWGSGTAPPGGAFSFAPNPGIAASTPLNQNLDPFGQSKNPSHFSNTRTQSEFVFAATANLETTTASNVATAASSAAESTMLNIAPSSFLNAPRRGPLSSLSPSPYDSPLKRAHDVSLAGVHHLLASKDISSALLPTPKGSISLQAYQSDSAAFLRSARASIPLSGAFFPVFPPSPATLGSSHTPTLFIAPPSDPPVSSLGEDVDVIAASISQARRRTDQGVVSEGGGMTVPGVNAPPSRTGHSSSNLLLDPSLWPSIFEGESRTSDPNSSDAAELERVAFAIGKARLRSSALSHGRSVSEGGDLRRDRGNSEGGGVYRPTLQASVHDRGNELPDTHTLENWMVLSIGAARSRAKQGVSSSSGGSADCVDVTLSRHFPLTASRPPSLTDPRAFPSFYFAREEIASVPLLSRWEEERHSSIVSATDKARQRILIATSHAESSDAFSSATQYTPSFLPQQAGDPGVFDGVINSLNQANLSEYTSFSGGGINASLKTASLAQQVTQLAPMASLYEKLVAASNSAQTAVFRLVASTQTPKDGHESISECYTDDFEEEEEEKWGEGSGVNLHVQVPEKTLFGAGDETLFSFEQTIGQEEGGHEDSIEAALEARLFEAAQRRSLRY